MEGWMGQVTGPGCQPAGGFNSTQTYYPVSQAVGVNTTGCSISMFNSTQTYYPVSHAVGGVGCQY